MPVCDCAKHIAPLIAGIKTFNTLVAQCFNDLNTECVICFLSGFLVLWKQISGSQQGGISFKKVYLFVFEAQHGGKKQLNIPLRFK